MIVLHTVQRCAQTSAIVGGTYYTQIFGPIFIVQAPASGTLQ
jgi:hypothetical protein